MILVIHLEGALWLLASDCGGHLLGGGDVAWDVDLDSEVGAIRAGATRLAAVRAKRTGRAMGSGPQSCACRCRRDIGEEQRDIPK